MPIASCVLKVTQGNLNNNHVYLHRALHLFPTDTLGGRRSAEAAPRTVRVLWGREMVETDIDRSKHIFRKRAWVARFFRENRVSAGDRVLLEQLEPYLYRLSKVTDAGHPTAGGQAAAPRCARVGTPLGTVADASRPRAAEGSLRDQAVQRDRFTCQSCGRHTRGQVHHIFPRRQGGPDTLANLVTLCGRCHMLISPIPLEVLCAVLHLSERQVLVQKARVEIAVHSWVLRQADSANPASHELPQARAGQQPLLAPSRPARAVPDWKRERPRAGHVWTGEEDRLVLEDFRTCLSLEEIARRRQRGVHAVAVRLCKLGVDWSGRAAATPAARGDRDAITRSP